MSTHLDSPDSSDPLWLAGVATAGVLLLTTAVLALPVAQTLASRLHLRFLLFQKRKKPPDAKVTALFYYPVKSLRAVPTQEATMGPRGFVHDRRYMLVTPAPVSALSADKKDAPEFRFLTQRQCPSLARVVVQLGGSRGADDANTITIFSTDDPHNKLITAAQPATNAPTARATVWGDVVQVQDMGDAAAAFVQALVDNDDEAVPKGVRLVVQIPDDGRTALAAVVPPAARSLFKGTRPSVSLADGFPILIASEASLAELNRRLKDKGKGALPMSRFRPNIVLRGLPAFAEDRIKTLQVGDDGIILHVVSSCPRCKESCTDQVTGQVTAEPVETMRDFRQLSGENVYFAVNAVPAPGSIGQTIRSGDAVRILQWGEPVWGEG